MLLWCIYLRIALTWFKTYQVDFFKTQHSTVSAVKYHRSGRDLYSGWDYILDKIDLYAGWDVYSVPGISGGEGDTEK